MAHAGIERVGSTEIVLRLCAKSVLFTGEQFLRLCHVTARTLVVWVIGLLVLLTAVSGYFATRALHQDLRFVAVQPAAARFQRQQWQWDRHIGIGGQVWIVEERRNVRMRVV